MNIKFYEWLHVMQSIMITLLDMGYKVRYITALALKAYMLCQRQRTELGFSKP